MNQITDKIRQQHRQEQAILAVELYQHERRITEIKERLRDIEIIMGTTQRIEDDYEKHSDSNTAPDDPSGAGGETEQD
jgi:uncharacterized membrane protein YccC